MADVTSSGREARKRDAVSPKTATKAACLPLSSAGSPLDLPPEAPRPLRPRPARPTATKPAAADPRPVRVSNPRTRVY